MVCLNNLRFPIHLVDIETQLRSGFSRHNRCPWTHLMGCNWKAHNHNDNNDNDNDDDNDDDDTMMAQSSAANPIQSLQLPPIYATPRPPRGLWLPLSLYSTPPHFRWSCSKCVSGKPQCHDTNVWHFWLLDSFTGCRLVFQWLCAPFTL